MNAQFETFHTDPYLIVHTCDGGLIIAQQVIGVIYQAAIFPFRKWNSYSASYHFDPIKVFQSS